VFDKGEQQQWQSIVTRWWKGVFRLDARAGGLVVVCEGKRVRGFLVTVWMLLAKTLDINRIISYKIWAVKAA
jgi:hypothetical protein